tara:strand:- start:34000 stop:35220 length:1221 start_codon:yes stop_codon:yes gene_type:complete
MDTPNLQAAFEQQLESLGKSLESTIEEWREAESGKRDELSQQIKALEGAVAEVKSSLADESRSHLPGIEVAKNGEREAFSMARACRAIASKNFTSAPYEKEVFDNTREKAMSSGVDPAGGYIVPEDALAGVIERLKANVIAYDLGARDLAVTGTPVTIPKITSSATGYWVSENSTITASDLGFEQINMTPKTLAGRVILSNLLLETSVPAADSVIEEDLASQLGIALDLGILDGSSGGGSGEPVGIMQNTGVSTVTAAAYQVGTPPTAAEMMEFLTNLDTENALFGRLGWALHPLALAEIRLMTVDFGDISVPLDNMNMATGGPANILGHPYRTSTQMTAPTASAGIRSILFGNWDSVMVARWGGLRLLASDSSDDAFSKDQTHIRATMRCDVALRHPEAFTYVID